MKKTLKVMLVLALVGMAIPAYAETSSSAGTGKSLSIVQFGQLPENHGAPSRLVQRRYEDYRAGRFVVSV